ncbi:MAG TPA: hypothetical protein VGR96_09855 [Acidobacteriaceae bacterium]|nr:hypothetical protein [Acidobacteriaceae bacterium]
MSRRGSRRVPAALLSLLALGFGLSACRSRLIDTTIVNQGPTLHLLEFDYPSASFGAEMLSSGGRYHYRFQIQGSGPVTLHFEDSAGKSHTSEGPSLRQGQEGTLTVTIDAANQVHWALK